MVFKPEIAKTSLQKLRKSLKKLYPQPSPKQIHNLRIRTRRAEAILHALVLDRTHEEKCLLRSLKGIRKKAGKVRDIDVFIGIAATLHPQDEIECLIQLLGHLGATRMQSARRLHKTFLKLAGEARRHLERRTNSIETRLATRMDTDAAREQFSANVTASTLSLWREVSQWPRLSKSNLHPFRIKVKELRYVLQLAAHEDTDLIKALGQAKDAIGEWHDWSELSTIASEVLHHHTGCSLLKQIRSIAKEKFQTALKSANATRKNIEAGGPPPG